MDTLGCPINSCGRHFIINFSRQQLAVDNSCFPLSHLFWNFSSRVSNNKAPGLKTAESRVDKNEHFRHVVSIVKDMLLRERYKNGLHGLKRAIFLRTTSHLISTSSILFETLSTEFSSAVKIHKQSEISSDRKPWNSLVDHRNDQKLFTRDRQTSTRQIPLNI